jgi:cobalt-zinc-cadmium resistance protein CzcA
VEEIEAELRKLPGNNYEFSQPIQMRFNELISGVRSDLAVKIYGDDLEQLNTSAQKVEALIKQIEGAADVRAEQAVGLPLLNIEPNRTALERYGLNVSDVQNIVVTAIGGRSAGTVYDGDKRFNLVVRLAEGVRSDIDLLGRLPIPLDSSGHVSGHSAPAYVPLRELATLEMVYA